MSLELMTPPSIEPVSYDQVVHHLRMDLFDETLDESSQNYINRLIAAVRRACEAFTNRAFLTQTWKQYLQGWPSKDYIELFKPPLQDVSAITYTDIDGTVIPLSTDYYTVDTKSIKGRVVLKPYQSWPSEILYPVNPIVIEFIAGYSDLAEELPEWIAEAILLQIGDLWDNREDFKDGNFIRPSEMLMWPYRVFF
jgi:uncharacterized phiE125 gp8 family phage protein